VPETPLAAPFQSALHDLIAWLESAHVQSAIIGGVAASILGRPRATRDIDVLAWIEEANWQEVLDAGARYGFRPRHPDALPFARRHRVLLVRHDPSAIDADIVLAGLPFEREAIAASRLIQLGGGFAAHVCAPEDLIIMKAVARRVRDLADIEAILDAQPDLDLDRVRQWVGQFAEALETPEMVEDLEAILRRRR